MMNLRETVARALAERNGSLEVWENYPPGTAYRDVFDHQADAVLAALGLDDFDAAVDRGAHAICDDPECVTTICNARARRVLEAALLATEGGD